MVGPERIELSLPKKPDFESGASTNSATTPSAGISITIIIFISQHFFYHFFKIFAYFCFNFAEMYVILVAS